MNNARQHILARLRRHPVADIVEQPQNMAAPGWSVEEKIQRFTHRITAVHGEVFRLAESELIPWLNHELPARALQRVLLGSTAQADLLAASLTGVEIKRYDQAIEQWKSELFDQIDVSITGCRAGIAETGSLVLWPDAAEPRLMSLVPPVHIALLRADTLFDTFAGIIEQQQWATRMPTNALLISGPSKTADIEQTLAYGIHGPKQLIVLVLE